MGTTTVTNNKKHANQTPQKQKTVWDKIKVLFTHFGDLFGKASRSIRGITQVTTPLPPHDYTDKDLDEIVRKAKQDAYKKLEKANKEVREHRQWVEKTSVETPEDKRLPER